MPVDLDLEEEEEAILTNRAVLMKDFEKLYEIINLEKNIWKPVRKREGLEDSDSFF